MNFSLIEFYSILFFYRSLEKDLFIQQKKHFGGAFVNITHSTVHVPTIIYSLGKEILLTANWSYNLNQAFIDNYNQDPELTWQYFCSQTGLYRVWPGHMWEFPEDDIDKLDLFDCRVQNWYIRATSSPRDVIILIDASGSMTGLKKSIAIQTVETILDTLSDDDFVQIIKVEKKTNFLFFNNVSFSSV
jgi:voltage-dependent calcium channel alpha-2/delta-3